MTRLANVSAAAMQEARSVRQHLHDVLGERFLDLSMARYRLADLRDRVLVPIVLCAVSQENTTERFDRANQV
jgi:hypothetical protein